MAKLSIPILLHIEREGLDIRVEEFNEHIIKIGKLSSVNLRLDDPNVNRIHAVIEVTGEEEAQIIDMGSSKGTHVNEKRIHKSRLVSGDKIQLGDTFLTIHLGEVAVAEAKEGGTSSADMAAAEEEGGTVVAPRPTAPTAGGAPAEVAAIAPQVAAALEESDDTAAVTPEQAAAVHHALSSTPAPTPAKAPAEDSGTVVAQAPQEPPAPEVPAMQQAQPPASEPVPAQAPPTQPPAPSYQQPPVPQPPAPEVMAQPAPSYQQPPAPQPAYQQPPAPQPMQAQAPVAQAGWEAPVSQPPPPQQAPMASMASQPPEAMDPNAGAYGYNQAPAPQMTGQPMAYGQQPQITGGFAPAPAQAQQPMTGGWPAQPQQPVVGAPAPSPAAPSQPMLSSASMASLEAADPSDSQEALEVRVLWGDTILDHNHFYEPKRITVGESRKNTFSISSEALPEGISSFPLIETEGDRLLINFTDKMGGELILKDQVVPLEQIKQSAKVQQTALGYQFALPAQSRVRLFVGDLTFEISFVPAPKRLPPAILHQMDHHLARSMGTSFLIHGILILLMLFADESPASLDDDFFKQGNRFAQLIIRPEEPEKKKKRKNQSGGAKAKGKKGKMGKKKAPDKKRRAGQKKKNPDATAPIDVDKNVEKEVLDRLKKKGMLGLLAGGGSRAGGLITAKGFGGDDADALGSWSGSKVGAALGSGGLGAGGVGSGGGGLSGDSIGLGRVGTYGRGGGKGGRGWGRSKLRNKRKRKITVSTGPPAIFGGLDKEIIRRIINQHRSRFKYCYERELIKNPSLQGKIHVWFQIEPNGRVYKSKISRTTMNNDRVEECLARRVKLLRFPSPKGGGVVHVNYPFIFRPS